MPFKIFDVEAATLQQHSLKPMAQRIPPNLRNTMVIVSGEFCGTFMFLFLAFVGTQTAVNNNDPLNPDSKAPLLPMSLFYIAASFGAALAVNVWVFYRVTGGMFNPAVSLHVKKHTTLSIQKPPTDPSSRSPSVLSSSAPSSPCAEP